MSEKESDKRKDKGTCSGREKIGKGRQTKEERERMEKIEKT